MCVDYTSLNKACSKDHFPLPRIDQIVDSTSGCEILSFLDAYLGYHQIAMKESDQLATSFITPYGSYCYVTMPFGLKNADATYQWCMQRCFADQSDPSDQPNQVERPKLTIAVYVDDIVVKNGSSQRPDHKLGRNIREPPKVQRQIESQKCVFRVPKGKLLG